MSLQSCPCLKVTPRLAGMAPWLPWMRLRSESESARGSSTLLRWLYGRVSECWRLQVEEAVHARARALAGTGLHSAAEPELEPDPERVVRESAARFDEIPPSVCAQDKWKVVHASRAAVSDNILALEAEALVLGVRHLMRNTASLGCRLLVLGDNMPVVLAATKGRGRSKFLRRPPRELAALLLATAGSRLSNRWIPSESNPADAPSRGKAGFFAERGPKAVDTVDPSGLRGGQWSRSQRRWCWPRLRA